MANRDMQSEMLPLTQTIALVQASEGAAYYVTGAEIDTEGADSIAVIVEPSRVITASDDIRFSPTECDESGGTFTAVDADALLPRYMEDTNFDVIEPTSPYAQVFGLVSNERFIKIRFNGVAIDTSDVSLVCTVVLFPNVKPAYDAIDSAAPSDGLA